MKLFLSVTALGGAICAFEAALAQAWWTAACFLLVALLGGAGLVAP